MIYAKKNTYLFLNSFVSKSRYQLIIYPFYKHNYSAPEKIKCRPTFVNIYDFRNYMQFGIFKQLYKDAF